MDEKGRFVKFSPARHFLGGHQGYNQLHMTPLYDIHFPSPYPMCLVNLHGKSDCFAEQEMYAAMVMCNFTSRIAREVVIRQPEEGIHAYRVNFKMAAALCREYFRSEGADYEKLLEEIGRHTVPVRPDRQNKHRNYITCSTNINQNPFVYKGQVIGK